MSWNACQLITNKQKPTITERQYIINLFLMEIWSAGFFQWSNTSPQSHHGDSDLQLITSRFGAMVAMTPNKITKEMAAFCIKLLSDDNQTINVLMT